MSRYRDDLAYGDYYGATPERWDRERFERMRARSRGSREVDSSRYGEDDYYRRGGGGRRDIRVEVDDRRRSRSRRGNDPYEERYAPRPEYLDRDRYDTRSREVAPYREPKFEEIIIRRPARPGLIRRQTSLDTFDRPPQPRYDQDERDSNANVNLNAPDPPRFEAPRYEVREEDYRGVRIRKERERDIYRKRRSSSSSFEGTVVARTKPKKGKTKFPKRITDLRVILDLGHPYIEEEHFYIVLYALKKDEIDEIIVKSKGFRRHEITTIVDESKLLEPARAESSAGGDEPEIIETTTTKIITNPTDEEIAKYEGRSEASPTEFPQSVAASIRSPSPSRSGRRGRSRSRPRGSEIFEEKDTTEVALILPSREKSRSRREIDEEIRRLELEKRAIRRRSRRREHENDAETTVREDDDYEVVEKERDTEVRLNRDAFGRLQLERNAAPRRSKSSRRRPTKRDVNAALFALT